jgi:RNA polymerase sigma factor (TIGR02999 family)
MDDHPARRTQLTALLSEAPTAGAAVLDRVVPHVYEELREMARRRLARASDNPTLQSTELVHEVYLRFVDDTRVTRQGRAYFFAAASRAMRQVLIESARRRGADKRGGGANPVTLDEETATVDAYAAELLDLDRALGKLEDRNPRLVRVVECRYFGGMSVGETAAAFEVSPRTVKSDWAVARAWLHGELLGDLGT